MIPKRQLLLLCKRVKGHKEIASTRSIYNWLAITEASVTSQRWLTTCSVSHAKLTSHDRKYASNSYDDDFGYFQDEEQTHSHQRNSSRKHKSRQSFDDDHYQVPHEFNENSGPRSRQWSDHRPFPRRRRDQFDGNYGANRSHMSDLYQRVKNKSRRFEEPLPVVKDLYSEHPDVTSRDMDDIQNFQDKYEISIVGSQKKRPIFKFEEAGFPENIMSALESMKFEEPSPIQCVAWPHALSGCDIVGIAQTGSGKTLSFILPAIVHVMKRKQSRRLEQPLALVICPTRELAMQVCQVAAGLRGHCGISSVPVYGGQSKNVQMEKLQRINPEIVVATPGRLMDLISCDAISLDQVSYVVLDEADRMLDMGFEPQIRTIMDHIQSQRQVLMFSATWPVEVHEIANDYLRDYVHLKIGAMHHTVNPDVRQEFVKCEHHLKGSELITRLQDNACEEEQVKTLVFCARKITCEKVSMMLRRSGISSQFLHGDCSQARRDDAMRSFRNGYSKVLIATDVAARGIDVSDIGFVINYDMPTNVDDYIHRVGRTARAGKKGDAVSFITEEDFGVVRPLTKLLKESNHDVPEFFYSLDYQGRQLKSAKNSLKTFKKSHHFRPRNFRF